MSIKRFCCKFAVYKQKWHGYTWIYRHLLSKVNQIQQLVSYSHVTDCNANEKLEMSYAQILLDGYKRRKTIYLRPEDFLSACIDYFQWCEDNPIEEENATAQKDGFIVRYDVPKVRAFTKTGLANFLGIPVSRFQSYKTRKDKEWAEAMEMIEQTIYTQKFEQSAAGLLNSSIIIRDLGLSDKQEVVQEATVEVKEPDNQQHLAIHVHPDDPDPLDVPRPLFSQAQLAAGIKFLT